MRNTCVGLVPVLVSSHTFYPTFFCLRAPLIVCTCSDGASPLPSPDSRPWDTPFPPTLYFTVPLWLVCTGRSVSLSLVPAEEGFNEPATSICGAPAFP